MVRSTYPSPSICLPFLPLLKAIIDHKVRMGDTLYADDKRSAYHPFSFGPRACLGRTLAYSEMRLILAKLVWSFDFELMDKSKDWLDQCKVMRHWVKPELAVKVTQVIRG